MLIDGKINANYANFGFIPYGQTIMGKIHYDPDDPNACKEFPDQMFNMTVDVSPFVLGIRGECSFV